MPRPQPLKNLTSALGKPEENGGLTPRTPHSRTARLEGGFARLEVSEVDDFVNGSTFAQQQSAPLLASSTSGRFTAGQRTGKLGNAASSREPLSRTSRALAYSGVVLAAILLLLTVLSFTKQDLLLRYIGLEAPALRITQPGSISYANYTKFPLLGTEYLHECQKLMGQFMSHGDYWDHRHAHGGVPLDVGHSDQPKVCNSTLTYMLDGRVGLAADLALTAQAAALARERNRTFFIDDTYWTRGKWLEYFEDVTILQKGPEPGCLPPPPQELVACPRTARHWVITAATAKYHLGHEYENHYENSYAHELNRDKPMFDFAEKSFAGTIRLNPELKKLVAASKQELLRAFPVTDEPITVDEHDAGEKEYISVHIRRGDRVPHGWQYHRNPIPIQEYVDAVAQVRNRTQGSEEGGVSGSGVVYLASDSPASIAEFTKAYQGPIFSIAHSTNLELKTLASPQDYHQDKFDLLPLEDRKKATKGALVDLAMVTGLWDEGQEPRLHSSVCSASSNFGRLAVIGLGWSKAFGGVNEMGEIDNAKKRWIDVDLKGTELPIWRPFELF
ncbi:hypothetical protein DFP72DRAFT_384287 [Ephemerocybe angulata]|uniref:Uncharacterized protein n=1 Tax=Ephemerocybe angulata TaxID=980116 RepID=A0A8H6HXW3_9AGAR|nr:hypothetical protein DFP72DRAFT_384287 [Tulosesus angulatus]